MTTTARPAWMPTIKAEPTAEILRSVIAYKVAKTKWEDAIQDIPKTKTGNIRPKDEHLQVEADRIFFQDGYDHYRRVRDWARNLVGVHYRAVALARYREFVYMIHGSADYGTAYKSNLFKAIKDRADRGDIFFALDCGRLDFTDFTAYGDVMMTAEIDFNDRDIQSIKLHRWENGKRYIFWPCISAKAEGREWSDHAGLTPCRAIVDAKNQTLDPVDARGYGSLFGVMSEFAEAMAHFNNEIQGAFNWREEMEDAINNSLGIEAYGRVWNDCELEEPENPDETK
jgi:hypothetical protein